MIIDICVLIVYISSIWLYVVSGTLGWGIYIETQMEVETATVSAYTPLRSRNCVWVFFFAFVILFIYFLLLFFFKYIQVRPQIMT